MEGWKAKRLKGWKVGGLKGFQPSNLPAQDSGPPAWLPSHLQPSSQLLAAFQPSPFQDCRLDQNHVILGFERSGARSAERSEPTKDEKVEKLGAERGDGESER